VYLLLLDELENNIQNHARKEEPVSKNVYENFMQSILHKNKLQYRLIIVPVIRIKL